MILLKRDEGSFIPKRIVEAKKYSKSINFKPTNTSVRICVELFRHVTVDLHTLHSVSFEISLLLTAQQYNSNYSCSFLLP